MPPSLERPGTAAAQGRGRGRPRQPRPVSGRTPGGSPSQVSGLEAGGRKSRPNWSQGPRPCQPAPRSRPHSLLFPPPAPHPGRTGAVHVTQGPAPRSFALTPRHPTRRLAPIGCTPARGGGTCLARRPNSPGSLAAALHRVRSQHRSSGCPDPEKIRDNSAARSWASRFTSQCLGVLICKMGTSARSSWD